MDLNLLMNSFSLASVSEKDAERLEVYSEKIGNVLYLKVSAASNPSQRLEKIYFNVISKEIFNDDESHQMETVWDWENKLDNKPIEVVLDGNKLSSEFITPSFQYFLVELNKTN